MRKTVPNGFTLIELLVVIAIMAVVGTFTLANFSDFGKDKELQNAALDIQSLLRTAQTNALASVKCGNDTASNWFVEFTPPSTINLKCNNVATPVKSLALGSNIQLGIIENTSPTVPPTACVNFNNQISQTCKAFPNTVPSGTYYVNCSDINSYGINMDCSVANCAWGANNIPYYSNSTGTSLVGNYTTSTTSCPGGNTVTLTITGGSSGGPCSSPSVKFSFAPLSGAFSSDCNNSSIMEVSVQNNNTQKAKKVKVGAGGSMSIAEGVAVSPLPAASNIPTPTPASTPVPTPSSTLPPITCPSSGLAAYWKMDSSSWSDSSGNGHSGTGNGGISTAVGKIGNGGNFDGIDDYITADSVNAALTGTGFSFGGWVKPRIVKRESPLSFHSIAGENRNVIFLSLDGAQKFHYWDDTPPWGSNQINSVSTYATGTYYHVFVTIDGSNSGKLYVNGAQEATFTTTVRPIAGGKFSIGQEWDGTSATDLFDGVIDEVGIWSRALSSTEIATLYNSGIGLTCP